MKRKIVILFIISLFIWFIPLKTFSTENLEERILVISSYSPIKEHGNKIITSFTNDLSSKIDNKISIEYMDSESYPDFEEWSQWIKLLFNAYQTPPKAVVILGGEAWAAYSANCEENWKNIPIILGGVKKGYIDYEHHQGPDIKEVHDIAPFISSFKDFKVTGYYIKDYLEENIKFIKRLQPQIRHIAFYYDNRYTLNFFEKYLKHIVNNIDSLDLQYFSGDKLSTTALVDTIVNMDNSYALLSAGWYTDVNHYPHSYSMLHNELNRYHNKYTYMVLDQGFSNINYLGGYFVSGKEIGKDLAELTLDVVTKGFENSPSFQITPSKPQYHINYKTLKSAGINEKFLPENVVLYNKKPSIFHEYAMEMIIFLIFIFSIITIFGVILYSRKRNEIYYKKVNSQMKKLLESMPDMGVIYDAKLNILDIVNPIKEILLIFKIEDLIGNNIKIIAEQEPCFKEASKIISEKVIKTFQTGKNYSFNYRITLSDRYYYAEGKTVLLEDGKVICFFHDTTAHVTAEKEIFKLKTFFQSVVDNLPVGLHVKDVSNNFRYLFYNSKVSEFYGENNVTVLGKNDHEINDPLADTYRQNDLEVLNSDTALTFERTIYDEANEPIRWGITRKTKIINNDGSCYIISVLIDTTEMRKKELELENTRRELSIAMDAGSLAAWIYDVNKRWFSTLHADTVAQDGLSYEEGYNIVHPEDKEKYQKMIEKLAKGQNEKQREIFRFKRGKEYNWYETYATGIKDTKTGKICHIIGTEKNITTDINEQFELEESKFKLELAFSAANMTPWEYDVENDRFYSSNKNSLFYHSQYSLEKYSSYIHPDHKNILIKALEDTINGENEVMDISIRIKEHDGHYEWIQVVAKAMKRDQSGKALKLIGTRKYITEAVEAERKLKNYIFKSDLVIKSGGIIQWDYNIETKIFSSPNPDSFMHHGIPLDTYLSFVHPEDVPILKQKIKEMSEGLVDTVNLQARVNIPGEGIKWIDMHAVAFEHDSNGKLLTITGLRRDITDLKNMTDELIILRDKAEESNRLKSAFLANMSHEIRTPLNAIVGFSNLIALTENKDEINEYCKIIASNNDLLLQLINDILDLSKIEAGQLEFVYSDTDIVSVFYNLEQIYKYRLQEGVKLICKLEDKSCVIHTEKNRITQIISNFLSNASKFTSNGCIEMGYERVPNGLRFYVTDTGKGISKNHLPYVFDRFAKFDNFIPGTGLGLSICQTIVQRLNGEIGVSSELGKGSTFWFTIPCKIISPHDNEKATHHSLTDNDYTKQKVVLITENNDNDYLLISNILKKHYLLIRATSAIETIHLHNEINADLILFNTMIPETDEIKTIQKIREADKTTPIIALTPRTNYDEKDNVLKSGYTDLITKPIDVKQLWDLLNKYI